MLKTVKEHLQDFIKGDTRGFSPYLGQFIILIVGIVVVVLGMRFFNTRIIPSINR